MLDTTTKKRIDDCRDILVGKLPDPKAQIEQITIALIYKFMDDMDQESIELGGKAKFFTDYKIPNPEYPNNRKKDIVVPFEKYAWHNLFDSKVTATELLSLYSEAIMSMDKNPNIPALFRDIFKNAFLPYRDPETLKLFLKTIGEFEYTHSEKLGDAFEYLLSVMGSQGDAGQFRTPRHIIDFVVKAVDPSKTDSILDPACGTAGFLISAFKYIRGIGGGRDKACLVSATNATTEINRDKACLVSTGETTLTPDERKKIMQNVVGYDISPDMVRLSLVNLYLHGFSDPHIYEYDTLSSEERWSDHFDVILANPPFMSPKGGIRPHKKFSISSNRSEVLFVDYIAEHLNPKGKAGIIVPEGVIFQSGTAYKALRKMLVEKYLYAVVSLPAGVFNPYSGVKTSILLMDKQLAKKKDEILFVKIDNDGYGLGAQRNEIKGGQLEQAIKIIREFVSVETVHDLSLQNNDLSKISCIRMAHAVAKKEIGKNGDYNLSGERYRNNSQFKNSKVEIVQLDDVAKIEYGYTDTAKDEGDARFIRITDIDEFGQLKMDNPKFIELNEACRKYLLKKDDILVARTGATFGKTLIYNEDEKAIFASFLIRINLDKQKVLPKYYWAFAQSDVYWNQANNLMTGGGQPQFNGNALKQIKIPLPPLSIQKEIVAEIEGYQKIIDGAKAVVKNYKPKIDIDPDWEIVELGEVCDNFQYGSSKKSNSTGDIICLRMGNIQNGEIDWSDVKYAPKDEEFGKYLLKKGDVLFNRTNSPVHVGKTGIYRGEKKAVFAVYLIRLNYKRNRILGEYLNYCLNTQEAKDFCQRVKTDGINQSNINAKTLANFRIPLPPIDIQLEIISQIEKEQTLVNANKQLVEIFEQKIKDRIAKVWGKKKKEYVMEDEALSMVAEE
jgi:type I restriction enzyme M protein